MSICIECWKALESTRQPELRAVMNAQGQIARLFTTLGAIPYPGIVLWARTNGCDVPFTRILVEVIQSVDFNRSRRLASEIAQHNGE